MLLYWLNLDRTSLSMLASSCVESMIVSTRLLEANTDLAQRIDDLANGLVYPVLDLVP